MPQLPMDAKHHALSRALRDSKRVVGYRGYSRILAASTNFFIARQFKTLNARVILLLQDDIAELEAELNELDRILGSDDLGRPIYNGSFRNESSAERLRVLSSLKFRLKEYSKLALRIDQESFANRNFMVKMTMSTAILKSAPCPMLQSKMLKVSVTG